MDAPRDDAAPEPAPRRVNAEPAPAVAPEPVPAVDGAAGERRTEGPRDPTPNTAAVRDEDMEPHAGLRYIARLFKLLALLLLLLLVGEIVIALLRQGWEAISFLLIEGTRLIVFAGLLWGAADLALMLIESNHDLRATRILVGRLNGKMERLLEAQGAAEASVTAPPAPRPPIVREPPRNA